MGERECHQFSQVIEIELPIQLSNLSCEVDVSGCFLLNNIEDLSWQTTQIIPVGKLLKAS